MTTLILALVLLLPNVSHGAEKPIISIFGFVLGQYYETTLVREKLLTQPKWHNLEKQIPLTVEQACRTGLAYLNVKFPIRRYDIDALINGRIDLKSDWEIDKATLI